MQVTLFSFLSTVLWHNLFIAIIYFLRKVKGLKHLFGVPCVFLLYLFSIVRMFFPFEAANPIIVESKNIYPFFMDLLNQAWWDNHILKFTVWESLLLIWISIAVFLLIQFFVQYAQSIKYIRNYVIPCDARVQKVAQCVKRDTGKFKSITVCYLRGIAIPMGVGVIRKHILLPIGMYEDKELYYILLHEYTHFIHHDLLIKLLISIFCIIFWWNPAVYLLKKDIEQTLEIKCDLSVTKHLNRSERVEYLKTIVDSLKKIAYPKKIPYISTAFFNTDQSDNIKERFWEVVNYDTRKKQMLNNAIMLMFFLLLIALSYLILPQPAYDAPPITNGIDTFEFDSTNAYLRETLEGYEFYIDDISQGILSENEAKMFIEDGFKIIKWE